MIQNEKKKSLKALFCKNVSRDLQRTQIESEIEVTIFFKKIKTWRKNYTINYNL